MGHTFLTHYYHNMRWVMRHDEVNQWLTWGKTLAVKHVLLYYPNTHNYAATRTILNIPEHLCEAFEPDHKISTKSEDS